jgi:hypothetical protein
VKPKTSILIVFNTLVLANIKCWMSFDTFNDRYCGVLCLFCVQNGHTHLSPMTLKHFWCAILRSCVIQPKKKVLRKICVWLDRLLFKRFNEQNLFIIDTEKRKRLHKILKYIEFQAFRWFEASATNDLIFRCIKKINICNFFFSKQIKFYLIYVHLFLNGIENFCNLHPEKIYTWVLLLLLLCCCKYENWISNLCFFFCKKYANKIAFFCKLHMVVVYRKSQCIKQSHNGHTFLGQSCKRQSRHETPGDCVCFLLYHKNPVCWGEGFMRRKKNYF